MTSRTGFSSQDLIEIFYRKKWMILFFIILSLSAVFILNSLLIPTYQATTTLLITRSGTQQSLLSDTRINPVFGGVETIETYIEILKSYNIAQGVAEKLPPGIFQETQTEIFKEKKESLRWPLTIIHDFFSKMQNKDTLESNASYNENPQAEIYLKELIEQIRNTTYIKPIKPTNIIEITCENSHPELVAGIANSMAIVFVEKFNLINRSNASETKKFIENQLLQKEKELVDLEEEVRHITTLENFPDKEFQLASLDRKMRVSEDVYLMLLEKYQEARISEVMEFRDIIIIDEAVVPDKPVKPKKMLNLAVGGLFGLIMGSIITMFLEFTDNTIKNTKDVEQVLGLAVLGVIPRENLKKISNRKK